MHYKINEVLIRNLDNTNRNRLLAVDTIAMSYGIIDYINGCTLLEYNETMLSDHQAYLIDINFKDYFDEQLSQ